MLVLYLKNNNIKYLMNQNRNEFKRRPLFEDKKPINSKISLTTPSTKLVSEKNKIEQMIYAQRNRLKQNQEKLFKLKIQEARLLQQKQRFKYKLDKSTKQYQQMKKHAGHPEYFIQNNQFLSNYLQQLIIEKSSQQAHHHSDPDRMSYEQLLELGQKIGKVSKGLTVQQMQSLKRILFCKSKHIKSQKCLVCCYQFKNNEKLIQLNCLHAYHEECIIEWFKEQNVCPLCKTCAI